MGPAPTGATPALRVALLSSGRAWLSATWAGGSGMRAQGPFAVAPSAALHSGVDEKNDLVAWWSTASVARSTHARTSGLARCTERAAPPSGKHTTYLVRCKDSARPPPRTHDPPRSG